MAAATIALLAVRVGAVCPNMCSGHGECGLENVCECELGWDLVADCSLKECPRGPSWGSKVGKLLLATCRMYSQRSAIFIVRCSIIQAADEDSKLRLQHKI